MTRTRLEAGCRALGEALRQRTLPRPRRKGARAALKRAFLLLQAGGEPDAERLETAISALEIALFGQAAAYDAVAAPAIEDRSRASSTGAASAGPPEPVSAPNTDSIARAGSRAEVRAATGSAPEGAPESVDGAALRGDGAGGPELATPEAAVAPEVLDNDYPVPAAEEPPWLPRFLSWSLSVDPVTIRAARQAGPFEETLARFVRIGNRLDEMADWFWTRCKPDYEPPRDKSAAEMAIEEFGEADMEYVWGRRRPKP